MRRGHGRTAGQAEADLQDLVKHDLARWEDVSSSPKGGAPTKVLVLDEP